MKRILFATGLLFALSACLLLAQLNSDPAAPAVAQGAQASKSAASSSTVAADATPALSNSGLAPVGAGPVKGATTEMPEVVVTGRAEDLIGKARSSSQGEIGEPDLVDMPLLRRGEVLESVPGMVVTQHSGDGKANQYFLRGFNLDHGTDFAFSVDDVPVNLPSHAHGQGYSDLNFLIPELISTIDYKKGPFYPQVGDFSAAGAANISLVNTLPSNILDLEGGMYNFIRALLAGSQKLGAGDLLYAVEYNHYDGPWTNPEKSNRYNVFLKYHQEDSDNSFDITANAYVAPGWSSSDQIPQRAVSQGIISRYGAIDPSDGGRTARYLLSTDWTHIEDGGQTKLLLYGFYYYMNLYSDFTYFLNDPVHGDQFEQVDRRYVTGGKLTQTLDNVWFGKNVENTFGIQLRNDFIPDSGLNHTEDRHLLDVWVRDHVEEFSSGVFYNNEIKWTNWLKTEVGGRGDVIAADINSREAGNSGNVTSGIFSPKASLILGPWDDTEFYLDAGQSFHSNDVRGTVIRQDPELLPQHKVPLLVKDQGAEIGARTSIVPGLVSTLSLFYLYSDSELTFDGDSGDTEANGASRRYGIEWANFYKPEAYRWLTFNADISLVHARYVNNNVDDGTVTPSVGRYIENSIPLVISSGVTADMGHGFYGSVRLRYFGSQPEIVDDSVRQPASTVVDMKVGYRRDSYDVYVDLLNLLDSKSDDIAYYYASRLPGEAASGVNDTHFHPMEPFEVRAGVTLHF
ncbi:MAG TPA: TonB-dependent receptor plug domain-containing protein [Chthoniobacteraceae bacterium]|jgi:hypothetical protein|nr:TonB-dependent receptor plug domain-containing protein [Chthoniobacteraceae bacterium]